jgi:hypothetical protein
VTKYSVTITSTTENTFTTRAADPNPANVSDEVVRGTSVSEQVRRSITTMGEEEFTGTGKATIHHRWRQATRTEHLNAIRRPHPVHVTKVTMKGMRYEIFFVPKNGGSSEFSGCLLFSF